ncbi:ThiF family adenylyltransferase [Pseudoclavibacter sp. Z016]|uniref:ThiF family adenylyltransferase n=1 Tax=Pseudoclavibacter sp. Z016 TaxID=2080581 RepID=UPI000CE8C79D|nr:ThiF family adenylyltransferase [Pseudoclavibacter sp. Z016]PPF75508.1 hypothetical protein C5B99_06230 [Pseudoclavibacter sp. Z016]
MSGADWIVLLPRAAKEVIEGGDGWGHLTCRISGPDRAALVVALSNGDSALVPVATDPGHFLMTADFQPVGHWYAAPSELAFVEYFLVRQSRELSFDEFQKLVPKAERPAVGKWSIAVTYCAEPPAISDDETLPAWSAWSVTDSAVRPIHFDMRDGKELVDALNALWPARALSSKRVLLFGAGSIGGATAESLASYGAGSIDVVDPDRLLFHNVPRHVLTAKYVGMTKVDALTRTLGEAWPECHVTPWRIDLVTHANLVRPLLDKADIVVCTVDGVEARRVANYLARRARKPIVFACVLGDGGYGEILRIRPLREVGCLECQRRRLREEERIDLEPTLDRGYGTGTRHNPMTAVGGDLHLMGQLTAKITVATLLRAQGELDQTLVDDNLVIALRPTPGYTEPFDTTRVLGQKWYRAGRPYDDCPACNAT